MSRMLWALQSVLAAMFAVQGVMKFATPAGLPAQLAWMYDLPPELKVLAGIVELLAAIGVIVPALLRVQVGLVSWSAAALVATMIGAAVWHAGRGETQQIVLNLVLAVVAGVVAYGRWRVAPLSRVSA